MKTLVLGLVLVGSTMAPQLARADGWWEDCDSDHDGHDDCGGCNDPQCKCSAGSTNPGSVGVGLGIVGVVGWRIGRKRRR